MSLLQNDKVKFDYEILETFEAGIELFGYEVKSLRKHQGSIVGAHVIVRGGETFLVGATVPPYQSGNTPKGYDANRPRKLLLSRKEISELAGVESQKGLTIVPISVYNKGTKIKVEIGIAKGKKKFDKRESIKKRETDRSSRRLLKQY